MSDIRFNRWLHQSGTGGVSQSDGGHVGIGTTNPLIPVGAGNTHILNVGVVTCNNIAAGSSITAGTFYGSGANLSSLNVTAIKSGGSVKAQANADGVFVTGILTATNFKTGVSNLHNLGLTLSGGQLDIGSNIKAGNAGVVTATSFSGSGANLTSLPAGQLTGALPAISGANLTGLPAGLGTALSSTQTSPLNKLYYTDRVLSIGSTVTIDHPASATGAYTHYADIQVEDDADLIVADGDDLIPDILGLGGNGTTGAGGAGRLLVDNIVNRSGTGAPTLPNGAVVTGVITATSSDVVIGTAGKGIDFSAQTTSSAGGVVIQSEKITHFEEGIYVPTIVCNSSGSITLNTSYNKLAYTRINNTVTVHGRVRVSAVSSPNGQQLRIGLPFTSNVLVGYGDAGRVFGYGRLENAAQHQYYYGISATAGNQDFVQIHRIDENTDNPANVCADVDSNARISVSFTYRAQ